LFVIRKVGQQKILFSQRRICLGFHESAFLLFWTENTSWKLWKKLKISYYLLIISNLVLKLLIVIYILFWIFVFLISSLVI
jgi:hypothetical protein